jgi:tetratricopeptide (TPR) repeat protein
MKRLALILALAPALVAQETRIASDYEIRTMQAQAASAKDFATQVSAHLNLGDLRRTRNEMSLAEEEYETALMAAKKERNSAREAMNLSQYATATLFAGVAEANLGNKERAFELLEEGIRYSGDDARSWNVYGAGIGKLHLPRKAVSVSRNAVALEQRPIDLAIDQYSLAIALDEAGETSEAAQLLESVIASLRSSKFDALRRDVAKQEAFETYSTVRGDVAAYLTILNRSQLQLANYYERQGDTPRARGVYQDVLKTRTDDPTALAALARLSRSQETYSEAFDANPFSTDLIRDYREYVRRAQPHTEGTSSGAQMRRALEQMERGEDINARKTLEGLSEKFPRNDTIRKLFGEVAASANGTAFLKDLRATLSLLAEDRITPDQRAQLDRTLMMSTAIFDALPFYSGTIDGVPFRFSAPTTFKGNFEANTPLHLTYRILGATELNGASALLLEPTKVEVVR